MLAVCQFLYHFIRCVRDELHFFLRELHLVLFHAVSQVVLRHHSRRLCLHSQVYIFGYQRHETVGIVVPDPDCGSQNPVVLGVVMEKFLHAVRKRMVRLYLDISQTFADRHAVSSEHFPLGKTVDVSHESSRIETQRVRALFELVQFFQHGYRYDNIIVLKLSDGLVVMQNDICVQDEYLRFPGSVPLCGDIGVPVDHV